MKDNYQSSIINSQLLQGDCLEIMPKIPTGSVDLILTDPPYCVGATSSGIKTSQADFSLIKPFFDLAFKESQRILKEGGHIYINTDWRSYPHLYPIMAKYFIIRNCIVWDYDWIKCGNFYRFTHEFILFATNGNSKRTWEPTKENSDVWKIKSINFANPNKYHSSEKPLELCKKIILNSTNENEVVLDFCCGSGSTCVAALQENRKFIGIELDENYFAIAKQRIENLQSTMDNSIINSQL